MEKSMRRRNNLHSPEERKTVFMRELSDDVLSYDSICDAARFLGIHPSLIKDYAGKGRKVIKSKATGKTYVISLSNKIISK